MKLYMIRHGQSENNGKGVHSGWMQTALSDKGREEARALGERLRGIAFDKVYSSDLIRAMETGRLALPDKDIEVIPVLREINVGEVSGKSIAECEALFGEVFVRSRMGYDFSAFGGESHDRFLARIGEFLRMVERSPYERVAAFCHGALICNVLDMVTGQTINKRRFVCNNCSVSVFEHTADGWHVAAWNYTGELL